ncbi:unnamed protein product [Schistocephalus solidus]|uniref:Thioredoxin domain-containing protein n=1 Tax=Schistocephalus solidus TaxID=70667 RepID=A0A183TH91_SCHSO|nr:unnamed protein product [Schistocephalus solidus]
MAIPESLVFVGYIMLPRSLAALRLLAGLECEPQGTTGRLSPVNIMGLSLRIFQCHRLDARQYTAPFRFVIPPVALVLRPTASYDTILVNFYADWCRFSQIFAPIFEEAGSQATVTFQNGAVAFAKVNCEAEVGLAGQYEIKKYPTIKLFKFGMPLKREYRGPRTIKSILQYIEENLNPRITFHPETHSVTFWAKCQILPHPLLFQQTPDGIVDERAIVGYFPAFNNTVPAYLNFLKLSFFLSDCNLHAIPSTSGQSAQTMAKMSVRLPFIGQRLRWTMDVSPYLPPSRIPIGGLCREASSKASFCCWQPSTITAMAGDLFIKEGNPVASCTRPPSHSSHPVTHAMLDTPLVLIWAFGPLPPAQNPPKREGCPEKVLSSINDLTKWAADICTPLVRRLTFANAEEITELNLPLLVLFHHPDDVETVAKFKSLMEQHFSDFQGKYQSVRRRFSVLYADGKEFSHPLMHLGKELTDLPLLAIDSFQHMYLFPGNVTDALK